MEPHFLEDDFTVFRRPLFKPRYRAGDVVVLEHASFGLIIKRIRDRLSAQEYQLNSDNKDGLETTQIGICHDRQIRGKVFWRIKRSS